MKPSKGYVLEIHYAGEVIRNITMPEIKDISELQFSVKVASSMDEAQGQVDNWRRPKIHRAQKAFARTPVFSSREVRQDKGRPSKRNKKDANGNYYWQKKKVA